ncbi:unnamed protein product [Timema podura]|uniref:Uncharacterized protein n=1 Tax=Timema podura TaxID=61482 RepID=A0ABN7PB87_TIMPD|nr:unnamed protein product [Timema podura]
MQLVISEAVSSSAIGRLTSMEAEVKRVKEERDSLKQGMVYIEEKLLAVTKENEALRTGMHEILDSVRSQDGKDLIYVSVNGGGKTANTCLLNCAVLGGGVATGFKKSLVNENSGSGWVAF